MKKLNYKYVEHITAVRRDSNEKYVAKFITKSVRFNKKNRDKWISEKQMHPCLYQKVRRYYMENRTKCDTEIPLANFYDVGTATSGS